MNTITDPKADPNTMEVTAEETQRYQQLQEQALDFARQGETEALELMVQAGMPVNLCDGKGQTLLMLASYHGHFETTKMLLLRGAEIDRRNDRGQTPLGGVAFKGYSEIASLLITSGADLEADNGGGMTPLMVAILFGRHETVSVLKDAGARNRKCSEMGVGANLMLGLSGLVQKIVR